MRWLLCGVLAVSVSCEAAKPHEPIAEPPLTAEELGRPWVKLYVPEGQPTAQLVHTPSGFVALSRELEGGKVLTAVHNYLYRSADGVRWERVPLLDVPPFFGFRGLAYGGGTFVMAGSGNSGNQIWASTDLASWSRTELVLDSWALAHAAHVNGRFFAFSTREHVFTSRDAVTWEAISQSTLMPQAVAFGNGRYVMVGSGPIQVSDDGLAWQARSLECALPGACVTDPGGGVHPGAHFHALFAEDRFFVEQLWSTDGETWQAHTDLSAQDHVGNYFFGQVVLADQQRQLHAWAPGQPSVIVAVTAGPIPAASIGGGVAPLTIEAPLPDGETCLTHRCVLVDGSLYLIR